MKKFFDRYLFSKLGLQVIFSIVVIFCFSFVATQIRALVTTRHEDAAYSQTFWGFCQVTDGGAIVETLNDLDNVAKDAKSSYSVPVVLTVTFLSWLIGLVLYSFVTGAFVNAFEGRREKIENGEVRYKLKDHGIVIGWDFQGVATVMAMFETWGVKEVVVLSEKPAAEIRTVLANELTEQQMLHVFIYNGSIMAPNGIEELYLEKSRVVMILGDRNEYDNDGGNLRIGALLRMDLNRKRKKRPYKEGDPKIQIFIDISGSYNLAIAEMFPAEGYASPEGMEVHIVNFCKATVREHFSSFAQFVNWNSGRRKGIYETKYSPLVFRKDTSAHLIIAGMNDMAKALILELSPLIGGGKCPGRVSVFSDDEDELARFAAVYPFEKLQNVQVEFIPHTIDSLEARSRLAEIVRNPRASVTLFITNDCADEAYATANRLPQDVRFENVRLMIEQRVLSKWTHKTYPMQLMGFRDVNFFGFLDRYLASCKERLLLSDGILRGETFPGTRVKYFEESFIDGILENFMSHGFCFEYNPNGDRPPLATIEPETLSELARFEHVRNVNFRLLHGVTAGTADDDYFQTSTIIQPWETCTEEIRARYAARISNTLAELETLYNQGEYPYILERKRYRVVLGSFPDESVPETQSVRKKIQGGPVWKLITASKLRTPEKMVKTTESLAFILNPSRGLARILYRISSLKTIPMTLVLSKSVEAFLEEYTNPLERDLMARWLRNAYEIVTLENEAAVERYIRDRSTHLLKREDDAWTYEAVNPSQA